MLSARSFRALRTKVRRMMVLTREAAKDNDGEEATVTDAGGHKPLAAELFGKFFISAKLIITREN